MKSLNNVLRKEIDKLESERLDLKSKLRDRALDVNFAIYNQKKGARAVELGLTADDLIAVEEYAAKLRFGEHPTENKTESRIEKPLTQSKDLEKLVIEIERSHLDALEARDQIKGLEVIFDKH